MEITKKMKAGYAIGGFGKNVAYGLVASYTLYYYNVILDMDATFIGLLLMAARIFDAFNDPLMGVVVAKTRTKVGRYKPWILSGAILNALIMFGLFAVPTSVLGEQGMKYWLVIFYFLCGITYTLSDIPYWSVVPAITKPGKTRESLTFAARIFAGTGVAIPTMCVMLFVPALGGGKGPEQMKRGFGLLALIIAIVYVVTTIFTYVTLPNDEINEVRDASIGDILKALFKNDLAMVLAVVIILFNAGFNLTTSMAVYIFQYDIGNTDIYTVFMVLCGMTQFLSMMVVYPLARKKFTHRQMFLAACVVAVAGYALLLPFIPMEHIPWYIYLIPGMLVSLANGIVYVQITLFVADAVDYGHAKTGQRQDSVVSSLQTLMVKLATAFSAFVSGIGIDLCKLVQDSDVQSREALLRLRILFAVPAMLAIAAAFVIFLVKKRLGREN